MSDEEMIERIRRGIRSFAALPPEEQLRRMIDRGIINSQGEVLTDGPNNTVHNPTCRRIAQEAP